MTPTGHNKILGILHLVYGGLMGLLILAVFIFMVVVGTFAADSRGESMPAGFLALEMIVLAGLLLFQVTPSFLAGYALLKQKRWAKTIGIIAAVMAGLNFPLGSALCVYTLWFLFGESGRFLYHKAAYALPSGNAPWASSKREVQRAYVPPSAPPDWR